MAYYVTLGGVYIPCVSKVSLTSGRDSTDYDGIGSGKFDVPESENLKEWTINCELTATNDRNAKHWQAAGYIFKAFEVMLKTKDYSRFIVTSDHTNISELVRLKTYTAPEEYAGVYKTEIVVKEYKPVAVKTTGVPYVARPGKMPVQPKVTITAKNTVYKTIKKVAKAIYPQQTPTGLSFKPVLAKGYYPQPTQVFTFPKTGKPVTNPAKITPNTLLNANYSWAGPLEGTVKSAATVAASTGTFDITATKQFEWMSKGINDFTNRWNTGNSYIKLK